MSTNSQTLWTSSAERSISRPKSMRQLIMSYNHNVTVGTAKSLDDPWASQSIEGRDVPDFEMLDAKTASALKKIISYQDFRRRVSVEERRPQKHCRFLPGKQTAHKIYGHFRATGACEVGQDLSDLFNVLLHGDDIQDFDTRWDLAL